jgi:hypothetical protein
MAGVSWATDRPGGFSEADLRLFEEVLATYSTVVEVKSLRRYRRPPKRYMWLGRFPLDGYYKPRTFGRKKVALPPSQGICARRICDRDGRWLRLRARQMGQRASRLARHWYDELESTGIENVRARLAQTDAGSAGAVMIGSEMIVIGFAQHWLAWHDRQRAEREASFRQWQIFGHDGPRWRRPLRRWWSRSAGL